MSSDWPERLGCSHVRGPQQTDQVTGEVERHAGPRSGAAIFGGKRAFRSDMSSFLPVQQEDVRLHVDAKSRS